MGFVSDGVNLMTVILDDSKDRQSVSVYFVARKYCHLLPGPDKSTVSSLHCRIKGMLWMRR